ncbi:CISD3 protein, partial [Trogon melanurus]|nr:CISD3 protein [Trogon melanurus]
MPLLRPAGGGGLMRAAAPGGVRRCRDLPGGGQVLSLPSVPRGRRFSAPGGGVIASKEPFAVELKAGKKWGGGACGHSRSQPFCDGAHKKLAPGVSPGGGAPPEDGTAWLCGCKRT